MPGLAFKLIQKLQQYRTHLSCFLREEDGNRFLNIFSCSLRNALTVIIWIISSRSYTDMWNHSNLHRNCGAKQLWSTWLAVPQSGWQFGALNLRSAHLRAPHAAMPAHTCSLSHLYSPRNSSRNGKIKGAPCCEGNSGLPLCCRAKMDPFSCPGSVSLQELPQSGHATLQDLPLTPPKLILITHLIIFCHILWLHKHLLYWNCTECQ